MVDGCLESTPHLLSDRCLCAEPAAPAPRPTQAAGIADQITHACPQGRHEQLELPLPSDLQALLSRSEELDTWLARQAEAEDCPHRINYPHTGLPQRVWRCNSPELIQASRQKNRSAFEPNPLERRDWRNLTLHLESLYSSARESAAYCQES